MIVEHRFSANACQTWAPTQRVLPPSSKDLPDDPSAVRPDVEVIALDEPQTQAELIETFRSISETTHRDTGHGHRAVHAKSHALLSGTLRVLDGLSPDYAQGIFATLRSYEALMRISANAGDVLPDTISLQRGFAIKVLDVDGERLPGSQGTRTQDFLMANGVAFPTAGPKAFLQTLKLLAATTDKIVTLKEVISAVFRTLEKGWRRWADTAPCC